jgi:ribonuclease R
MPDSPEEPPIRIPGRALSGAWPGDRVVVSLERRRGGAPPYGRVVRVVERGIREFVGRFSAAGGGAFVRFRAREGDILVPATLPAGPEPVPGELVLAEVSDYPGPGREGKCRVLRVLGKEHTLDTIVLSVVSSRNLPAVFPEEAVEEADRLPRAVRADVSRVEGGEGPSRVDQRALPFVTIDGEDARDFDDAVCLVRSRGRTRLLVAIADVSHYVPAGGAVDREAYRRGTSVYFPDRCIPMLPARLSEGICSLNPGVNRLAVTVEIPIGASGRPESASFYPSVIRSRARLTYDRVHAFLRGSPGTGRKGGIGGEVGEMLRAMEVLAGRLTLARGDRGALDLELPEAKIDAAGGLPVAVERAPRWEAHRIIEEFMLLANAAVAEFLASKGLPFLFRIHEPPPEERLEEFETAAARLLKRSRTTDRGDLSSRLQAWADAARGGRYEKTVHMLLLRSLMLARYGQESLGHFGLALSRYTHFTSPIRRYPDLIVHRSLKAALGERRHEAYMKSLAGRMAEVGAHLSGRERGAVEAERDVEQRAKALFLSKRTGEIFRATITSVLRSGFFVELDDHPIEGHVHISTLRDDTYRYSEERGEWCGAVRKGRFALGDRLRVRLFRADADRGWIDFLSVEKLPETH